VIGVTARYRGCSGIPHDARYDSAWATSARWGSITPFARPVVPPVYCSHATSSSQAGPALNGSGANSASSSLLPSARSTITCLMVAASARMASARSANDSSTTSTGAPTSSHMNTWSSLVPNTCKPVNDAPSR